MGNPYEALRRSVHAAVGEYYRRNAEKAGTVLVQMTPEQCHEVVTGMRHDPTVFGVVGYPVEQMVARQLERCIYNGTRVQVQVIRDVEARIVVGMGFALPLVEPFPAPTSPQERPEPEGGSVLASGRQGATAGLSLAVEVSPEVP